MINESHTKCGSYFVFKISVIWTIKKKLKVGLLIRMDVNIEMDILYEDKNIFNTQFL